MSTKIFEHKSPWQEAMANPPMTMGRKLGIAVSAFVFTTLLILAAQGLALILQLYFAWVFSGVHLP